jgi:hypothetical protein
MWWANSKRLNPNVNPNELSKGVLVCGFQCPSVLVISASINREAIIGLTYLGRVIKNKSEIDTLMCI